MFKSQILDLLKQVVDKEYHSLIEVFVSPELNHGDYSTNIAMILASKLKKNPREIANGLMEKLKASLRAERSNLSTHDVVSKVEIAGAGYINFFLKPEAYREVVQQILTQKDTYGDNHDLKNKKIMLEYGHPNPFKVMHIGHLRNFCLGVSIARLLEASGATVIRTNYQGDVGMHVAKCVWALKKRIAHPESRIMGQRISEIRDTRSVIDSDNLLSANDRVKLLSECYVEGAKAYEEDGAAKKEIVEVNKRIYTEKEGAVHELWKLGVTWSLEKFHEVYKRVYAHFDREYMESETLPFVDHEIEVAMKKKILKKSKGAIIFDGSPYGIDTRVYLNSESLPTYEGKQLGLLVPMELKDFGKLDKLVFNVAVEQISFFKSTIKVIELMYPEYAGVQYHNAYEFVGLKSGKMSSRKGQVITAEAILDEAHQAVADIVAKNSSPLPPEDVEAIALAAVKFSFLRMSAFKYLAFDLESSVSMSGDSGPYIQYTYARCQSVLRKAPTEVASSKTPRNDDVYNNEELAILKALARFPEVVQTAAESYDPHFIAVYLNELAQAYNTFYNKHAILGSKEQTDRLQSTAAVAQVLKKGLYLLGIRTVEKM